MKSEPSIVPPKHLRTLLKAVFGSWLLVMVLPVEAQFTYFTNNGTIIIMKYVGANAVVSIPSTVGESPVVSLGNNVFANDLKVKSVSIPEGVTNIGPGVFWSCGNLMNVTMPNSLEGLGDWPFYFCGSLKSITIPAGVRRIGGRAFQNCVSLIGVYFKGDAPTFDVSSFYRATNATVYSLPGTTGWDSALAGIASGFVATSALVPHAIWRPQIDPGDSNFGIRNNMFGFTINWASGMAVAVDSSSNLVNPVWTPLQTNTLASDSFYFSDPQWTNYPSRFYRVRSP